MLSTFMGFQKLESTLRQWIAQSIIGPHELASHDKTEKKFIGPLESASQYLLVIEDFNPISSATWQV
jgi:hypothetical protein